MRRSGDEDDEQESEFLYLLFFLCERHTSLRWSETEKYAWKHVCLCPTLLFKNQMLLSSMSYKRIESFVHTQSIIATEFDLFRLIQMWAEEDKEASDSADDVEDSLTNNALSTPFDFETQNENRPKAVSKLLSHIDMTRIDPNKLLTTVKSSGLVSDEQLQEVTATVLMRAYEQKYFAPYLPRMLVWEDSSSTTFESYSSKGCAAVTRLKCPAMKSGIFKWKIFVDEIFDYDGLGVASTDHQIKPHVHLAHQLGGWVVEASGRKKEGNSCSYSSSECIKFKKGSQVTFILDLTGTGELSASVDGHLPAVKLFSNMKMANFSTAGFVPAACLEETGKVTFMGFYYDE